MLVTRSKSNAGEFVSTPVNKIDSHQISPEANNNYVHQLKQAMQML